MSAAVAWIVPLPGDVRVAMGGLEFVHVLTDAPAKTAITDGPVFMNEAVSWDGGLVPVFDAGKFSHGIEKNSDTVYYGIVRYRSESSNGQRFGALKMIAIPQRISVDDQMACDLPDSHECWRPVAVSCFQLDGHPVPVLDLARLFSQAPLNDNLGGTPGAAAKDSEGTGAPDGRDPNGYTDPLAIT